MLSASFMDYCMPRADNMRTWRLSRCRRCARIPASASKGCGEVGTIGSPATVINAVVDALSHLGCQSCRYAGNAKPHLAHHSQQRQSAARSRIGAGDEGLFIHKPSTVSEAVALLAASGENRPAFRWHDAAATMKMRLASPAAIVDLAALRGERCHGRVAAASPSAR